MPIQPAPLDPRLGAEFSVAAALRRGATPSRLRARDLERPYHGARRTLAPLISIDESQPLTIDRANREGVLRDARAYFAVAPGHAFLAGRSAAIAWGAPIDPGEELCVGVLAPHRAPRRPGIRGLKLAPTLTRIREHDGMRLTSPASTWAELGGELSHRELVIVGDAFVCIPRDDRGWLRPDRQLATIEQLTAAAMAPGRRNRPALLAAIADIRVGSMSALESEYRMNAQDEGLPEPALNIEIRDAWGALIGIGDIVHVEFMTIVEIEGDQHRTSRRQWLRDLDKYAAYAERGYELVRLGAPQVRGRHARGPKIVRAVLQRRGWAG